MTRRFRAIALALAAGIGLAGCLSAGAARADGTATGQDARALLFDGRTAFEYSQRAIGRAVDDHRFVDRSHRARRLADYRGKPLLLTLIYTGCSSTCPIVIQDLYRAVERAQAALGPDAFAVATVGFDTRNDTPERLASYARSQGVDLPNWDFLSGDPETIERLAAETGFIFAPSPAGFDHLAQVTILDAGGRIYRQVYGGDISPQTIVEPLKDVVFGRRADASPLAALASRIRLVCTVFDPNQGRYRFSYAIFIGLAIGVTSSIGVAVVLARAWIGQARG